MQHFKVTPKGGTYFFYLVGLIVNVLNMSLKTTWKSFWNFWFLDLPSKCRRIQQYFEVKMKIQNSNIFTNAPYRVYKYFLQLSLFFSKVFLVLNYIYLHFNFLRMPKKKNPEKSVLLLLFLYCFQKLVA